MPQTTNVVNDLSNTPTTNKDNPLKDCLLKKATNTPCSSTPEYETTIGILKRTSAADIKRARTSARYKRLQPHKSPFILSSPEVPHTLQRVEF